MTDHGPGLDWLAERAGIPPAELVRDHAALLRALSDAGRDALDLTARLGSEDAETRAQAEDEAHAVRQRLAQPVDTPTPGQRFATEVTAALRAQAERLRRDGDQST